MPAAGRGAILLVEDDEAVRHVARRILNRAGYTVLVAGNGHEALAAIERHAGPLDLVLTDAVMPALGGGELIRELRRLRPTLPVLVMSGYGLDHIKRTGGDFGEVPFLPKPFGSAELLGRVRHMLDLPLPEVGATPHGPTLALG